MAVALVLFETWKSLIVPSGLYCVLYKIRRTRSWASGDRSSKDVGVTKGADDVVDATLVDVEVAVAVATECDQAAVG